MRWEALRSKESFPSHPALACAMQRRRPGGLNPTLLEGSPRNVAGEYAAGHAAYSPAAFLGEPSSSVGLSPLGLDETTDAHAAMQMVSLGWSWD